MNFIIDGLNIAYRSHYVYDVKKGLTNSQGIPTGIVYGFLKTYLKWKGQYPNANFVVAWDCPEGKLSRQEINPEYKANRSSSFDVVDNLLEEGEDVIDIFTLQINILREILSGVGVDQVSAKGFEADDVIHTLVRKVFFNEPTIILSSDKDFLQLVSPKDVVLTPEGKTYDGEAVYEKFGVRPDLLLPFRAFDGDASDGLSGIPKVRRKKIAKALQDFEGDFDAMFSSDISSYFSKKELEKVSAFKDKAYENKEVMALKYVDNMIWIPVSSEKDKLLFWIEDLNLDSIRDELLGQKKKTGFIKF